MAFLILGKMLLLLVVNIESNGKIRVSDMFISASKTLIEISLAFLIQVSMILLSYFCFFKIVYNSLNLVGLILACLTIADIRWAKQKDMFLDKALDGLN